MLNRILSFCLAHRMGVLVGVVILVVWGGTAWQRLNLDAVPDITTNQVQINTETGGMGPLEVERLVTFPVETSLGGLPGLVDTRSLSQYGLSQVTATFTDDTDIYFARQLVAERLGRVELPSPVGRPQMGPVSTGLGDIYMFALESATRSPAELREMIDYQIAPQLRTVPGVAEINVADGSVKQYQVVVDPSRLVARGLSVADVVDALQRNNANAGGGVIENGGERILVRGVGVLTKASDVERVVVKAVDGVPVLVRDVANVQLGTPILTGMSSKDGREAVVGVGMMLKGANGRTVARALDARIRQVKDQLPKDVTLTPVYNRADLVDKTVETVQRSLVEGGILVIVVLVALLGNLRGALVVALAIPLSMLVAISLMDRFGMSGNLMSLGAIDFGLIVDGAVVMIENAVRRLAEAREHAGRRLTREEVRTLVGNASREVAKPTAFAVSIITVVYLPVLALEGTEGKMFRPMAFTVVFALLGALALTLTLVPALASMVLSGDTREGRNRPLEWLTDRYHQTLRWAMRVPAVVVGGALLLLAVSGWAFTRLGSEFIPTLDEGDLVVQPIRMRTVSADVTRQLVGAAEKKILDVPEVKTVFSRSGTPEVASDPMPLSLTDSFVMLRESRDWRPGMTKERIRQEIEKKLNEVPGQGYNFSQPIQMRFAELVSGVKADVGIKVFGEDLATLRKLADEIAAVVREVPGAVDVEVEQVEEIPVLQVEVDRDAIARQGVSVEDVQHVVEYALSGETVGQVSEGERRFGLAIRLPEEVRNSPERLGALPIPTPNGATVPLASLAKIERVSAPAQVSREGGKRRVVVQLNVRGADLGSFVTRAQAAIRSRVTLPEGYYLTYGGQFENLQRASSRLTVVVPVALGLIFGLLYLTFGSARQAAVIFSGVPLAVTGGILGLAVRGMPFSISAGVGFIALSGVAVLNGVVMVSAINGLRAEGMALREAVQTGARRRLRPVLMTALVAALGFVPMALNTGIGAEVQRPLATVVIGGILTATTLTLLILPVLYTWSERRSAATPGGI